MSRRRPWGRSPSEPMNMREPNEKSIERMISWAKGREQIFHAAAEATKHGQAITNLGYSHEVWAALMEDAAAIFELHRSSLEDHLKAGTSPLIESAERAVCD
jgi:hypothetical protein